MRVAHWQPDKFDETFEAIGIKRLVQAAEVVAKKARAICEPGKITRPVYKKTRKGGPGKFWTAREPGTLKRSIRVVRRKTKSGKAFSRKLNVRVYAGHRKAFYARFVEFGTSKTLAKPFLRPAFYSSMPEMKSILGVR